LVRSFVTFLPRLFARVRDVELLATAASLSFTTLLGLVPLTAMTFAFVARFPFFAGFLDALEAFLLKHVMPASAASVVRMHVLGLAERAAQLTGWSILFVGVTAVMLIATIEREVNLIWGIAQRRPLARRLVVYVFGLTLGPVLVGASITLTTFVVTRSLAVVPVDPGDAALVGRWLPLVFTAAALSLLYAIAPAVRVPRAAAVAAGTVAALAFEAAKQGFAWYVSHLGRYEMLYGALAALPVFMIWVYLSWLILLAGAAVGATLSGARLPPRRGG
jgi:membrane protein